MATNPTPPSGEATAAVVQYLQQHERKSLLRFITCGSVDDGKSTLIGRLLHDTKLLFDDQLAALEADSLRHGTQNGEIDFALLVDGLAGEREQGITIDVAYRFFDTEKRKFIVADCPGHEQYTRNMATGASTADLAIVLVDARKGLLTQTRRHSYIVSLLGIRHVLLAVNKMDLVGYDQGVFEEIAAQYRALAGQLGIEHVTCIPLSALKGDNMLERSAENSTRSILFTATATCLMPSSDTMKLCRRVCCCTPWRASMRMMARSQFDAPVAMLRVYCSWPGQSAMMNLRRLVEK